MVIITGGGMTRKLYKSLSFSADNDNYIDFEDAFKENGFSWSSYIGAEKWEEAKDFMPYDETSKILKLEYDIAHKILGGDWRMPTSADFVALFEACGGAGKVIPPSEVPGAKMRTEVSKRLYTGVNTISILLTTSRSRACCSSTAAATIGQVNCTAVRKTMRCACFSTMKMSPRNSPATASSDSLSVLYQIDYNLRRAPC